jgi:sodium-dependent phosphate cotransporter
LWAFTLQQEVLLFMTDERHRPSLFVVRTILLFSVLYVFLVGIKSLGGGLSMLGKERMEALVGMTNNPFIGLIIGILVTSVIQSSSTTTSIVVGLVGAGQMSVSNAVPIIMGANIGTTVTNTIVAVTSIGRRDEFRRAIGAATMHDFFNVLVVIVLLPLEIAFGFLTHAAEYATTLLGGFWGATYKSPLQQGIKWGSHQLASVAETLVGTVGLPEMPWAGVVLGAMGLGLIFFALIALVRLLKSLMLKRVEILLDKYLGGTGFLALLIGFVVTALVQSSSVTTSTLVPVVAAGVITLEAAFPITLGANVGTTVTALLASLAADDVQGLTIALAHFLFNILGILIFYVHPRMRQIPLGMARWMGDLAYRSRVQALAYLAAIFFVVPAVCILVWRLLQ